MKTIHRKTKVLQHFLRFKTSMMIFQDTQGQLTPHSGLESVLISNSFRQDIIAVVVTAKNEEYPMNT